MKLSMYELSITGYMWRFFLMMGIVIAAVFTGQTYLALFASVLFLSMMLGIKVETSSKSKKNNVIQMNNSIKTMKKAS